MRSLDTNILARYVMQDDPLQTPIATAVLAEPSYVSDTVMLELAWLLSSRYALDRAIVADTLADIVSLPSVRVAEPALLRWAIARFKDGADFADMVHLVSARHTDGFVSFERRLARQAGPDAPVPIEIAD